MQVPGGGRVLAEVARCLAREHEEVVRPVHLERLRDSLRHVVESQTVQDHHLAERGGARGRCVEWSGAFVGFLGVLTGTVFDGLPVRDESSSGGAASGGGGMYVCCGFLIVLMVLSLLSVIVHVVVAGGVRLDGGVGDYCRSSSRYKSD